jgi:hypothetical protein
MSRARGQLLAGAVLVAIALVAVGCGHRSAAAANPRASTNPATTEASDEGVPYRNAKYGFLMKYPKGWSPRKGDNPEDVLTVDQDADKHTEPEITVSVPKLPPHIPGMIPMGSVESGYVDDVKKRMKNVKEVDTKTVKVDGVSARRFVITGQDKSGKRKLVVLAMMKGDHLFVLTGEGPENEFATVETGFEQVVRSWKWKEKK